MRAFIYPTKSSSSLLTEGVQVDYNSAVGKEIMEHAKTHNYYFSMGYYGVFYLIDEVYAVCLCVFNDLSNRHVSLMHPLFHPSLSIAVFKLHQTTAHGLARSLPSSSARPPSEQESTRDLPVQCSRSMHTRQ